MKNQAPLDSLYPGHLAGLCARTARALETAGFDSLLVYSGAPPMQFLDDQSYPFKVNPHFKQWVPVLDNPDCFVFFRPGERPTLLFHRPVDFWYKPAELPQAPWVREFELVPVADLAAARAKLAGSLKRAAFIGEPPDGFDGDLEASQINPKALLDALHFHRAVKSAYEIECIRRANEIAARGHKAAAKAFRAGGSEFDAHLAYLQACGQREEELPYNSIVAYNTNGAVLHYQHLERVPPAERRSFLIDAGAHFNGYAADITRTYSAAEDEFAGLIGEMDRLQQQLCAGLRAGVDWRDVQMETHRRIGDVLRQADVITLDGEAAVAEGLTAIFFPHGVGHLLGLQVHDVGGFLRDETGAVIDKPKDQPFLRLTRRLEPGFVVTVEPGLYFIDALLEDARGKALAKYIRWERVEALRPCGGIRIEDNVAITPDGCENLTRPAFA